jgi:hypothetical protein
LSLRRPERDQEQAKRCGSLKAVPSTRPGSTAHASERPDSSMVNAVRLVGIGQRRSSRPRRKTSASRSPTQPGERLVRRRQREGLDLGVHRHLGRQRQELLAVGAREVRDRADAPLAPQQVVGERGDLAHVDAGAHDAPTLGNRSQRGRDQRSCRREDDRRVNRFRRSLQRRARPLRAQGAGEGLALAVPGRVQANTRWPDWAGHARCSPWGRPGHAG